MCIRDRNKPGSGKKLRDFLGLKISKQSYIFNIRRRFEYVLEFKPQKKPEGIEIFRQIAQKHIKELMSLDAKRVGDLSKIPRSPAVPKGIMLGLAFLILFIIGILLYFLFFLGPATPLLPPEAPPGSSFSIFGKTSDIIWYGQVVPATGLPNSIGVASVSLSSENITKANLSLFFFDSPIADRVVFVESRSTGSALTQNFSTALETLLDENNQILEREHLDQLQHSPSALTVYVFFSDSGYMPASIVGLEKGKDMLNLTKEGDILLFAGFALTDVELPDGTIAPVDPGVLQSNYGLSFQRIASGYVPSSHLAGSFIIDDDILVASFEELGSKGKIVIIPKTLSRGWNDNVTAAAEDFFDIIAHASWLKPVLNGSILLNSSEAAGSASLTTSPNPEHMNITLYPFVTANIRDTNNRTFLHSVIFPPSDPLIGGGILSHEPQALPTEISGKKLKIDGSKLSQISTAMSLEVYSEGNRIRREDIRTPVSANLQYDYFVDLPPGDYVLALKNSASGKVYAKSYLHVPLLTVEKIFSDWNEGHFGFKLLADGVPFEESINLDAISAQFDGAPVMNLEKEEDLIVFEVTPAPVPAGNHEFTFTFGTSSQTLEATYTPRRNWWDETEYQLGILIVAIVFFIGYSLKRPDVETYSLDVPDFPPLSKISIPVKKSAVLELFNSVNSDYKWEYMPLKISEIKSGFRKMYYKGKGIRIGDYNTERILNKLVQDGSVKSVLGLYALSSWEEKSGRSVRYLAIFRRMRDVFVNNAIRFEELNSSKQYDTRISAGGGMLVHIYDPSPETLNTILSNSTQQRQLLLFANDSEKVEFEESLESTSKARVLMKMLISSGRLALVTVSELEAFLKKIS